MPNALTHVLCVGVTGAAREHLIRDWGIAVLRVEERGECAAARWINGTSCL